MKGLLVFTLIPLILLIATISLVENASAQSSIVPEWVKNNALWWAEGKISEQEYLNSIQFLIDEEIIKVKDSSQSPPGPISTEDIGTQFGSITQAIPI